MERPGTSSIFWPASWSAHVLCVSPLVNHRRSTQWQTLFNHFRVVTSTFRPAVSGRQVDSIRWWTLRMFAGRAASSANPPMRARSHPHSLAVDPRTLSYRCTPPLTSFHIAIEIDRQPIRAPSTQARPRRAGNNSIQRSRDLIALKSGSTLQGRARRVSAAGELRGAWRGCLLTLQACEACWQLDSGLDLGFWTGNAIRTVLKDTRIGRVQQLEAAWMYPKATSRARHPGTSLAYHCPTDLGIEYYDRCRQPRATSIPSLG